MEVVTYCYAWNSQVGCKNIRDYMAHASPDLRDQINVNSVVAVKLDMNKENRLMGSVVRVYGQFEDPALSCEFIYLNNSLVGGIRGCFPSSTEPELGLS